MSLLTCSVMRIPEPTLLDVLSVAVSASTGSTGSVSTSMPRMRRRAHRTGSPLPRTAGFAAGFNGGIALVDAMIHHQDIRRPLKLPRVIPPERLKAALDFAKTAPTIRGFGTDAA